MSRGFGKIYHSQRLISKIKKLAGNTAKEAKLGVGGWGKSMMAAIMNYSLPLFYLHLSPSFHFHPFYLVVASCVNYD
jgi:hypothetical protein